MNKMSARKKKRQAEGLRSEYRFDYSKSKPNRFAAKIAEGSVVVVLEQMSQPYSNRRKRSTPFCAQ